MLKLLSKHRSAFATARRLGYFNRASMHHAANTQSVAAPAQPIQRGAQTQTPRAEGTQRQRKGRERAAKYQARTAQATAATTQAASTQSATPTEPPLGAQRAPPAPTPSPSSDPSPGRQVEVVRPEQPGREGIDVGRIGRTDVPPPEEPRDVDMDETTLVDRPGYRPGYAGMRYGATHTAAAKARARGRRRPKAWRPRPRARVPSAVCRYLGRTTVSPSCTTIVTSTCAAATEAMPCSGGTPPPPRGSLPWPMRVGRADELLWH